MRLEAGTLLAAPALAAGPLPAPQWIRALLQDVSPCSLEQGRFTLQQWCQPAFTFSRLRLPSAASLNAAAFEAAAAEAYHTLRHHLPPQHPHVVRCWNYLPGILQPVDARRDRYMVFNAGRFTAFQPWLHSPGEPSGLPAASAVGHDGEDLLIDVLAIGSAGESIENPRQIPAVQYSADYGPRPPCFSRACRIDARLLGHPMLLISGTASIRGEITMHPRSLALQLQETWLNLDQLLNGDAAALADVRVYHLNAEDREEIAAFLTQHVGPLATMEFTRADLCRVDLRVEIEAIAHTGSARRNA